MLRVHSGRYKNQLFCGCVDLVYAITENLLQKREKGSFVKMKETHQGEGMEKEGNG